MHKKGPQISSLTLTIVLSTLTLPLLATENAREVIVIESSKQSIPLERIDSSVLVKTGEELERAGIYQVQDLGKVFPGLVIQSRGNRTYANTTIRGISSPIITPPQSVFMWTVYCKTMPFSPSNY